MAVGVQRAGDQFSIQHWILMISLTKLQRVRLKAKLEIVNLQDPIIGTMENLLIVGQLQSSNPKSH